MARMVAEGLIGGEAGSPRLLGGRRLGDGKIVFPLPVGRERDFYEPISLSDRGVLWSYTVQRFRPKAPYADAEGTGPFAPYAVGYVELPGQIIVESRIVTDDLDALKIGMPVRLTLLPFHVDEAGEPVLTYAFEPRADGDHDD